MCREWLVALTSVAVMATTAATASGPAPAPSARGPEVRPQERLPGRPAPPEVVAEIRHALDEAIRRFNAKDAGGVLAHVSDRYRTGSLTKAGIADQLRVFFALNEEVTARIRIDAARLVSDTAWVYTSGEVSGRPRWLSQMIPVLSWQRELEIARRETAGWRIVGLQR